MIFLILLSTFVRGDVTYTLLESTSPQGSRQSFLDRVCHDEEQIRNCFVDNVLSLRFSSADCKTYDTLAKCFKSPCPDGRIAMIAAQVYAKHTKMPYPKELFIELRQQFQKRCHRALNTCGEHQEQMCYSRISSLDRAKDHSYKLEFQGVFNQYRFGIRTRTEGCRNSRSALNRWANARAAKCGAFAASCLCETYQPRLEDLGCTVHCVQLQNYPSSPSATPNSARQYRNANSQGLNTTPESAMLFCLFCSLLRTLF